MLVALILVLVFFKKHTFEVGVTDSIASSKEAIRAIYDEEPSSLIGSEYYLASILFLEDGGLSTVSKPMET